MINYWRASSDKVTDFAPGSIVRTILEAPAAELEEFYIQVFLGLRDAIPVAVYKGFDFDLLGARYANGYASVARDAEGTAPIAIPAGTQFTADDGRVYASTSDVIWLASSTFVAVPVQAQVAGAVGNGDAGTITGSQLFPLSNGYTVSSGPLTGGADAETEADRAARFVDAIAALSMGTRPACVAAVKSARILDAVGNLTEYVTRTGYSEVPGRVYVWVYSNHGQPSFALLAAAQTLLDGSRDPITNEITSGVRAAGVRVDALAMAERTVSMSIAVKMLDGYALTAAVRQQLTDIYDAEIRAVPSGEVLQLGTLVEALLAADGVFEIVPGSTENLVCAADEALVPGTLTIGELA